MIIETEKIEDNIPESPYCELCTGCGEEGCCSHISCYRALVNKVGCSYGETYLKEVIYNKLLLGAIFEKGATMKKEGDSFLDGILQVEFDKVYDQVYRQGHDAPSSSEQGQKEG